MSNYGLACMILDLVKKDFLPDIPSGSSLERIASGTSSGNTGVSGDSSGSDYRGSVFPGKDDSGELIKCKLKPGSVVLKSLKTNELSQIKIVDQNGGDNIVFKYDDEQEFDWNSGDGIGKGGYGEVKLFTLSDGEKVAIKKYPTWKFDKDIKNVITDVKDLSERSNEGTILEKIDEKCGQVEKEGRKCIRSCDIVPAHYIKSSSGRKVFLINTKLPQKNYSKSFNKGSWPMDKEYSFIAMEAMDGSLRDYAVEQKKELDKLESDDDKRILLDKIFVNVTKIILEVAKVLQCLSDKEYYYPDLKSDNVLYKCDGENIIIKMGDIGSLTEKKDLINGDYTRTYYDSQGNRRRSISYDGWTSNPKYYHVYLLGYLYIDILTGIFGINFGGKGLKEYTKDKYNTPNDEQIREDINKFMGDIRKQAGYLFPGDYYYQIDCKRSGKNKCIGERFSVLIYDILHKTIVSQLKLRYKNENELIGVLNRFINKTNEDKEGE